MKKIFLVLLVVILISVTIGGCRQADRASHNISLEADNFNIVRKLTAFNQRTGEIVFVCAGNFSIDKETDGDLAIIGEDEDGFYKHFVYLSSEVGYVCEQMKSSPVSKYKFTINYNPAYLWPVDFDFID